MKPSKNERRPAKDDDGDDGGDESGARLGHGDDDDDGDGDGDDGDGDARVAFYNCTAFYPCCWEL